MKRFIVISIFIILGGLYILYLSLKTPEPSSEIGINNFEPFCGTNAFYDESTSAGKQLFNANCAACHKLDKHMTGPALRNVGNKYDSITIMKLLRGKETLIVNNDYTTKCVIFPQLSNEDIFNIIAHTK